MKKPVLKMEQECEQEARIQMRLAALLRHDAARLAASAALPAAAQIFHEAELRRQKLALARVAMIFRVLRVAGITYGVSIVAWLLHLLMRPEIRGAVQSRMSPALPHLDTASTSYIAGGLVTLTACIAFGIWITLRDDRGITPLPQR